MLLDLSRARTPRPGAGLGVQDRAPTGAERPAEAALGSSWLGASRPPSGGQVLLPPSCGTCGKHVASPRPSGTGIGPSGGGRGRRRYVPCAPRAAGASFAPASPALPGSPPVSPGLPGARGPRCCRHKHSGQPCACRVREPLLLRSRTELPNLPR